MYAIVNILQSDKIRQFLLKTMIFFRKMSLFVKINRNFTFYFGVNWKLPIVML